MLETFIFRTMEICSIILLCLAVIICIRDLIHIFKKEFNKDSVNMVYNQGIQLPSAAMRQVLNIKPKKKSKKKIDK